MSKYRPRKPNPNVEYTFLFPSGRRYTLRFMRENENGSLVFYNLTTKQNVKPMTLRRFDYMLDKNLMWSKRCDKPLQVSLNLSRQDKINLRVLKGLTEDEKAVVNSKLAYDVEELDARYRKAVIDKDDSSIVAYRAICESIAEMAKTNC